MSEAAIRKLEDNLAFRYVADSDRPTNIESIEKSLLRNQKRAIKESHDLHGTIGPNPAYDESGELIIDTGYAPDLALTPFLSKKSLAKIPKALGQVKDAAKFIKKHGLETAWDTLGLELIKRNQTTDPNKIKKVTKAYIATRKTIQQVAAGLQQTKAGLKKVKDLPKNLKNLDKREIGIALEKLSHKPYTPTGFKEWLLSTEPHKLTKEAIEYGKKSAIKDIASLKGFKRYIHTVKPLKIWDKHGFEDIAASKKANDPSSPGYKALYKAFNTLVRSRIEGTTASRMSRLETLTKSKAGGYAQVHKEIPNIALREGVFSQGPKWGPTWTKSSGVHEATHIGQLQPVRAYNEIQHIAKQSGMNLNTREGQRGVKWLDETFFGSAVDPNWKKYYGEKLQPYLKKGFEMTDTKRYIDIAENKSAYFLQAEEFAARFAEIRKLESLPNPTPAQVRALKAARRRESEWLTEEGIDYGVNKLWMATPAIPIGLDEDLFKEVRE